MCIKFQFLQLCFFLKIILKFIEKYSFFAYSAQKHTHTHTHTHTYTHTHTHRDIQGFRGGALGGCVFSSEENLTTIISTQVAADIMNWAFQT